MGGHISYSYVFSMFLVVVIWTRRSACKIVGSLILLCLYILQDVSHIFSSLLRASPAQIRPPPPWSAIVFFWDGGKQNIFNSGWGGGFRFNLGEGRFLLEQPQITVDVL